MAAWHEAEVIIPFPPPRSSGPRPVALFDTECFPNFWCLKLRPIAGQTYSFEIRDGARFTPEVLADIARLFDAYCVVSFYGNRYDVPMLRGVFAGFNTQQLKWLNDQMIVSKVKPWELGLGEWVPEDHIDVMEVCPGEGSQNCFAARIHHHTIQDLPHDPGQTLTELEMVDIATKCENDLDKLHAIFVAVRPMLEQREALGARYGIDLRSKSDAQVAEAVLRLRCEAATGSKIYKPNVDWNMRFMYRVPDFISYSSPQLQRALDIVRNAVFSLNAAGAVAMPHTLEDLEIKIGSSTYKMGIGGLHSQEKKLIAVSDENYLIRMPDVTGYYPKLIINSGESPISMGHAFTVEYESIYDERVAAKRRQGELKKAGDTKSPAYVQAYIANEGGKIMVNGTFGKTGNPHSILFAPTMLIQTTVTGQLSLFMLIEWFEAYGIAVISANTDGLVTKCPRDKLHIFDWLITEWEKRTGLNMETEDYRVIYARDVNTYFAIDSIGGIKRKGEYGSTRDKNGKPDLQTKKNPDVEICADAVADFLSKGVPIAWTITQCLDLTKFITCTKVNGGGVKMWGEGPRKGDLVRDMTPTLEVNGWAKSGRKWTKDGFTTDAHNAYKRCFEDRKPEYLGKFVRWYYSTQAPGPILTADKGYTVSLSYGARPCMVLPSVFPTDIDYQWYVDKAHSMLVDVGFYVLQ